jgi:LemA protein
MANELDEMTGPVAEEGKDANVITKQLPITVGAGSKVFNVMMYVLIIPAIPWIVAKIRAGKYLSQLQQRIQQAASQIDNYMEQRVVILQNAARLVEKGIDLDKTTFTEIARLRSGGSESFSEQNAALESVSKQINIALEAYPDLKAHQELEDAMQQNSYTQREITAAREHYNDVVNQWNRAVYEWPAKQIVAAKRGYTTRIPFAASKEVKEKAREVLF